MIAIAVLAGGPSASYSAGRDPLRTIAVVTGECKKLVFADRDYSSICEDVSVNFAYASDHSSFQFAAAKTLTVGFYGEDHEAKGDVAELTVQKLSINNMDGTPSFQIEASGRCVYANPYAGPATIACVAVSSGKTYAVNFLTDGDPPEVRHM